MQAIQYTIRNIPPQVDKELKKLAKITGKSFNQTVVDELITHIRSMNAEEQNFDWMLNTMDDKEADEFDQAIKDLNRPDPKFWQ